MQRDGLRQMVPGTVTAVPTRAAPGGARAVLVQLVVFAGVGGVFNVVYALLYLLLRETFDAQWANGLALVASTIAGTGGTGGSPSGSAASPGRCPTRCSDWCCWRSASP